MAAAASLALLMLLAPAAPRPAPRPLPPAAARLARELAAPTLDRRFAALHAIEGSPALLKNPAFGRAIAAALARDYNPFWTKAQRKKALLGEGFAEFYGQATDLLLKHYGLSDPVILRVLALGAFVPGSRMAYILAGQGSRVMPYLLQLWRRGPEYNQAEAVSVLGFLLMRCRDGTLQAPLTMADRNLADRVLHLAMAGPNYPARLAAVSALGLVGSRPDLAPLAAILRGPECGPAPPHQAICPEARDAIRQINRRLAKPRTPGCRPAGSRGSGAGRGARPGG